MVPQVLLKRRCDLKIKRAFIIISLLDTKKVRFGKKTEFLRKEDRKTDSKVAIVHKEKAFTFILS